MNGIMDFINALAKCEPILIKTAQARANDILDLFNKSLETVIPELYKEEFHLDYN